MSYQVKILLDKLPQYRGDQRMLSRRQDTYDIIREILAMHEKAIPTYNSISADHWKGSAEATARHLYDFLKNQVPYQEEPTLQQTVKYPQAILAERLTFGNDCKHFASYANGVGEGLRRLGYPVKCFYRFASYNPRKSAPKHVFAVWVISGREYWIDPVPQIGGFNNRAISPAFCKDKMPPMSKNGSSIGSLYEISGINDSDIGMVVSPTHYINGAGADHWLDGVGRCRDPRLMRFRGGMHHGRHAAPMMMHGPDEMGKAKKPRPKRKRKGLHIKIKPGKLLKKVGGAAPRNAFLALLKINGLNKAVKLRMAIKQKPGFKAKLDETWRKWGGNTNKLSTAIQGGINMHNRLHPKHKVSGYDSHEEMNGWEEMNGLNEAVVSGYDDFVSGYDDSIGVAAAGAAALIAAAAPILKVIGNLFKSFGVHDDGAAEGEKADEVTADEHNGATDVKGDGNKDVNPDGSVDHGNGVTTKVETDPATGKQVIKYDVKEPSDSDTGGSGGGKKKGGGAADTSGDDEAIDKTGKKVKEIQDEGEDHKKSVGEWGGDMLQSVTSFISQHKVSVGLTGVGAVGLIMSMSMKSKKGSMVKPLVGIASAVAIVAGGIGMFKK